MSEKQLRDALTALEEANGLYAGKGHIKAVELIRAALSQPAPSPQPADSESIATEMHKLRRQWETTQPAPQAGEREKAEADAALYGTGFIVDGWRVAPHRVHILALRPQAVQDELNPEFTDTARAALLWVLWHHQGGSSPMGQSIRYALGMGAHERLNAQQISEAKRWASINGSQTEMVCCGCPNMDTLNDRQIVSSLRGRYPEPSGITAKAEGGTKP